MWKSTRSLPILLFSCLNLTSRLKYVTSHNLFSFNNIFHFRKNVTTGKLWQGHLIRERFIALLSHLWQMGPHGITREEFIFCIWFTAVQATGQSGNSRARILEVHICSTTKHLLKGSRTPLIILYHLLVHSFPEQTPPPTLVSIKIVKSIVAGHENLGLKTVHNWLGNLFVRMVQGPHPRPPPVTTEIQNIISFCNKSR